MTVHRNAEHPSLAACMRRIVPPLGAAAIVGGLLGGLGMIGLMILDMGASGMGYATPLNVGMAAFSYTITPPTKMLPMLMQTMGGHATPAMMASMHAVQTGHATNATTANLMAAMPGPIRNSVMASMPVSASHVSVGSVLHFAFSAFMGVIFVMLLTAGAWLRLPGLRTGLGLTFAGALGGALLYVVMRWAILPSTNPMMAVVPQVAFFFGHLLYGALVGGVLAFVEARTHVFGELRASPCTVEAAGVPHESTV